jgi:RNA polymerase sigma-70 factor (ECF subfamily)
MIKHQQSEPEVIEKVIAGESTAFELLIRSYNPYLYKIGRTFGFIHEDVEDLMQEAFISAYRSLGKLDNKMHFKTWLTRIMLNECYKKGKKKYLQQEKIAEFALYEKTVSMTSGHNYNDPLLNVRNKELSMAIENAIRKIPVDYRLVFTLRELNCMSVAETSHALSISEANVKVRLNRAKAMLRKEIEKMYCPEEIFEFNLVYCDAIVSGVMKYINSKDK